MKCGVSILFLLSLITPAKTLLERFPDANAVNRMFSVFIQRT